MEHMPNINTKKESLENPEELREKAVIFFQNLTGKQNTFVEEIQSIVNDNESLKKALREYAGGDIKDSLGSFKVTPWLNNLERREIEGMEDVIKANTEHVPALNVLQEIEHECNERMIDIKDSLSDFSGDSEQAFSLIEKLHKDKNITPLNSQEDPLLQKM